MTAMKTVLSRIALIFLTYNVALILLSLGLSAQAVHSHPMRGELISTISGQVHALESDDTHEHNRPAIVLLHGVNTSALDFTTNLLPLLGSTHHVVAIDRPGHGYSDRGDLEDITSPHRQATIALDAIHAMGIEEVIVVGHSWSGSVVMAALLDKHDNVEVTAGVLIAGATHPWEGNPVWHIRVSQIPVIGDIFRWQYIPLFGRLSIDGAVASAFAPESVPEDYVDNTGLTLSLRPSVYQHNAQDRTQLKSHLASQSIRYTEVKAPLLSIAASEDTVVPAWNHHDRLLDQIPHIQTLMLEGAGHAPHHTQPQRIANAINEFVMSLP